MSLIFALVLVRLSKLTAEAMAVVELFLQAFQQDLRHLDSLQLRVQLLHHLGLFLLDLILDFLSLFHILVLVLNFDGFVK